MKSLQSNERVQHFDSDLKSKKKDISSVIKNLLKKSSIYAISQVGQSSTPLHKILWLIVFSATVVGCGFQVYRFLDLYFKYPVIVNLSIKQRSKQTFPSVTVCNLNRMNSQFETCIDENRTVSCPPVRKEVIGGDTPVVVVSERQTFFSCRSILSGRLDERTYEHAQFLNTYSKTSKEERQSLGYKAEDIIIKCSFNGVKCEKNDFYEFQNLQYGNCFTFKKLDLLQAVQTSYGKGLELVINTRTDEYMKFSQTIGTRILVHDPAENPNPEQSGINISPGYEVSISLKQTKMAKLPAPYKDRCVNYTSGLGPYMESPTSCTQACMQTSYYEKCGCIEPTLLKIENKSQCSISNRSEMCCIDGVLNNLQNHGSPCECQIPCITTYYHEKISMSVWPSETYFRKTITNVTLELYRKNHVKVNLQYSTPDIISYEQTPVFEYSELLGHLGGAFGLWLGISFAAMFELLEALMYLIQYEKLINKPNSTG